MSYPGKGSGATVYLDGTGAYSTPAGGAAVTQRIVSTFFEASARYGPSQGGGGTNPSSSTSGMVLTNSAAASFTKALYTPFSAASNFGNLALTGTTNAWSVWTQLTTATNDPEILISIVGNPSVTVSQTTGHTMTGNHIGFFMKTESGVVNLYATQANGTTETRSSVLTTVSNDNLLDLLCVVNSSSVDYYFRKNDGSWSSATNLATRGNCNVTYAKLSNDISCRRYGCSQD